MRSSNVVDEELLGLLVPCGEMGATPPYIARGSRHYRYALLVTAGYRHQEACRMLDVLPESARNWRKALCRTGEAFWGRAVTYEMAARYATDPAFRMLVGSTKRRLPENG